MSLKEILRGAVEEPNLEIFYMGFLNVGGSAHIGMRDSSGRWNPGDLVLFFLRKERGEFRTICDFYDSCAVEVFSGLHPDFTVNRKEPFAYSIVDLLLTRGVNATDVGMIKAIDSPRPWAFSEHRTLERLRTLSNGDQSQVVRRAALEALATWERETWRHNEK